ncbi:hypothetical protein NHF46_16225 [Arthrobacter alpinus]|nr:hypothetical protein [Arthrobacter alpinus]
MNIIQEPTGTTALTIAVAVNPRAAFGGNRKRSPGGTGTWWWRSCEMPVIT